MRICSLILFLLIGKISVAQDTVYTVDEAIKDAVEKNFNVQIARNEIEIGRINNNWSTAGALPNITANGTRTIGTNNIQQKLSNGTTLQRNGATVNNTSAGLNVNWIAFNGYRMFATKKRLEELERQGEFVFQRQVSATVFDVISAYYNIVRFKQQVRAMNEQIKLSEERLFIAESRFRIGTGAKNDVLQAQVDMNEQRAIKLNLENSLQLAVSQLNLLTMRSPSSSFNVVDTIILNAMPDSAAIIANVQSQNPDVLLARSNLAVLVQTRREINSERLPTVTLNGNYNFNRNANSAGFTLFNQTIGPSASIGVSVPIFNGGVIRRQLRVADITYRNQQLSLDQLTVEINARVRDAYTNYRNALAIVDLERKNFGFLRENVFIARERFRHLAITSIELRQVQISLIDAQTRMYNALFNARIAQAELELLTGELAK
jgi:outer membrane protein